MQPTGCLLFLLLLFIISQTRYFMSAWICRPPHVIDNTQSILISNLTHSLSLTRPRASKLFQFRASILDFFSRQLCHRRREGLFGKER
ncbi:hypothetical protein B0H67DRAFT_560241 [Lasiosphaeris hirsuta]|uniref:Secreted protein n=1 Tax=Lasiosphaeris hirsuta TaxID=260670 RepID=A0AA40B974_9PEZI|nr:hypothetical protein B0H67DRAFT_560241 [Lasiosphaeris hirsuta]